MEKKYQAKSWFTEKKINKTYKLLTSQDKSRENTKLPTSRRKEAPSLLTTKT